MGNYRCISHAIMNDAENPVKVGDIMYLQWDKDYPYHATSAKSRTI